MLSHKHFAGQHDNEIIHHVVHRHWFDIASHFAILGTMSLFLLVSFFIPSSLTESLLFPHAWLVFFQTFFLIFLWLYLFIFWIDYYFDVWIITNERIINIEQKGLFQRIASELHLERVQDVTAEVRGFFPTLLDFGDVIVETAGHEGHFLFRRVPDPYQYKELVMRLSQASHKESLPSANTAATISKQGL